MLTDRQKRAVWTPCKRCVEVVGYVEDAPKFASDRGLNKHLREEHNGAVSNDRERFTL